MRKFLLVSLFLSVIICSHAQLKVAIIGGGHQSSIKETNDLPDWDSIGNNYTGRTGVHFGFLADIPFSASSKLYLQPGVMLSNKGRKYAGIADTSIYTVRRVNASQFINYIDLPLNLVLKLGNKTKFLIGGGPYASFFFNGKEKTETLYKNGDFVAEENGDLAVGNAPGKYKTLDYGVNGLAGIEFGKVFLTVNYNRSLNDFYRASNYDGSFKHQVIGGTLGIFLGKTIQADSKLKDRDRDGIPDNEDNCLTRKGAAITKGCPDKDGDGVADKDDECPDATGLLKYHGCPIPDTDKDGVNDEKDKCLFIAGLIKYDGCPVRDIDNDGIYDLEDKCPLQAGFKRYDGCPVPDRDKDGVTDEVDKCPDVFGSTRNDGCPLQDKDGDGVNDREDKCPTVAGTRENKGCPKIREGIIQKVNYAARRIQFKFQSADLLPQSYKVLNEIAVILKQNPDIKLSIEGHTSSDGEIGANIKLSQNRASAVKKYLESKNIDPSRLKANGYGQTQPLNNGETAAEKAKNRRVELKLSNY